MVQKVLINSNQQNIYDMGTHCDDQNCGCQIEQPKKKLFVAMSHTLTPEQIADFDGEIYVSQDYVTEKCAQIPATDTSANICITAYILVAEAQQEACTHFAMNGEPCLVYHSWNLAKQAGLTVVQSTTERQSIDVPQPDGTVLKTAIFKHVNWRVI